VTLRGAIIAESLREGFALQDIEFTVVGLRRIRVAAPAESQPQLWTLLQFEAPDESADDLASRLQAGLLTPGWYANFDQDVDLKWVVFPGKTYRYRPADSAAHDDVLAYAARLGIPEEQRDW
jgi:hypothetical protein